MSTSLPLIDFTMDGHMHTTLCNHATGTMEEYVQSAIQNRLHTISFLEHLEVGIQPTDRRTWLRPEDFDAYFTEGNRLRKKYAGKLTILLGVEAGYNPDHKDEYRTLLKTYPWDRVGLSLHFIKKGDRHFNLLTRNKGTIAQLIAYGIDTILEQYYASLIDAVQIIPCDVVCHLDAVLRNVPGIEPLQNNMHQVEQLLNLMAQKKIALEINTSGFTYRKKPFPGYDLINKAIQKGIPLQLGSDAHAPSQVARHFNEVQTNLLPRISH